MLIRSLLPWQAREGEVTPEPLYQSRRAFLAGAAGAALAAGLGVGGRPASAGVLRAGEGPELSPIAESPWSLPAGTKGEEPTPWDAVTTYNNFYEFGTGKDDPAANARGFSGRPWTVSVDGAVARPGTLGLDDLLTAFPLEERIYRLRCVEAWSMVIPWVGFPLAALLRRFEPLGKAKYVAFQTLHDPARMPGQRRGILDWPYVEGLRLDEALHPLTILAVGLYGRVLPGQNGAPIRLVVPWKYGFKSIKSIVRISLTETEPPTTWNRMAANEYGFYANVNPAVDHPRWSQAKERRIGEFLRRDTLPFNGYGESVAGLYGGMDLSRFY